MKYTKNGSRYITEDERYTIKKNYNTGAYTIYDCEKHEFVKNECGWTQLFYRLKDAKAFVESLYA